MLHVLEVVVTLFRTRGTAEIVERHRRDPTLGETQRELLVEAVKAAHVRKDHDTDLGGLLWRRREGCETVAVSRLEDEVLVRDGGAADHGDRRNGVQLEAHVRPSLTASKDPREPKPGVGLAVLPTPDAGVASKA